MVNRRSPALPYRKPLFSFIEFPVPDPNWCARCTQTTLSGTFTHRSQGCSSEHINICFIDIFLNRLETCFVVPADLWPGPCTMQVLVGRPNAPELC